MRCSRAFTCPFLSAPFHYLRCPAWVHNNAAHRLGTGGKQRLTRGAPCECLRVVWGNLRLCVESDDIVTGITVLLSADSAESTALSALLSTDCGTALSALRRAVAVDVTLDFKRPSLQATHLHYNLPSKFIIINSRQA